MKQGQVLAQYCLRQDLDKTQMDLISIEQLKADAIIGIYKKERITPQPIIIDMDLFFQANQAAVTDSINYALDYHVICKEIHEFVSQSQFQLIETLAEAIVQRLWLNPLILKIKLKVSKPEALKPMAANVSLTLHRTRN